MKNKIIFILFTLLVFSGVAFYIKTQLPKGNPLGNGDVKTSKLEELPLNTVGIEQNANPNMSPPDLDRPINITENLPDVQKKDLTQKIIELSSVLKKTPDLFETWLILGIYRKTIGDYQGAREIWEYTVALQPGNFISYNNLGDLYAFYLKDNKKAEQNFNKAIELSPNRIQVYNSFYEFYRYVMKDDVKTKALLQKGIAANPGPASQGLQDLLNNY